MRFLIARMPSALSTLSRCKKTKKYKRLTLLERPCRSAAKSKVMKSKDWALVSKWIWRPGTSRWIRAIQSYSRRVNSKSALSLGARKSKTSKSPSSFSIACQHSSLPRTFLCRRVQRRKPLTSFKRIWSLTNAKSRVPRFKTQSQASKFSLTLQLSFCRPKPSKRHKLAFEWTRETTFSMFLLSVLRFSTARKFWISQSSDHLMNSNWSRKNQT